MNRLMLCTAIVAAAAGLAHAIDFTGSMAPAMWTTYSNSWGSPTISQSTADTIDLRYDFNGNTDAYNGLLYTDFEVVATESSTYTFDYSVQGFHSWFMAYADMWVFADDANGRQYFLLYDRYDVSGGFVQTGSTSITVGQGYKWGVSGGGGHFDGTNGLAGTITLSNLVPAPGAAALFGIGALTVIRRRR